MKIKKKSKCKNWLAKDLVAKTNEHLYLIDEFSSMSEEMYEVMLVLLNSK